MEQLLEDSRERDVGYEVPVARAASGAAGDIVGGDTEVALFVRLAEGQTLDDTLRARIKDAGPTQHEPSSRAPPHSRGARHPRTLSGKTAEIAVRDALHGRPVKNTDALANPSSLEEYQSPARGG